jgi:hypothetical protein
MSPAGRVASSATDRRLPRHKWLGRRRGWRHGRVGFVRLGSQGPIARHSREIMTMGR